MRQLLQLLFCIVLGIISGYLTMLYLGDTSSKATQDIGYMVYTGVLVSSAMMFVYSDGIKSLMKYLYRKLSGKQTD